MTGKSVLVAGAGNIGSYFLQHLARMPEVGRVVVIDQDIYEPRNLDNQNILPSDVGQPKGLVQARRLAEIRPNLEVTAIHAPLESVPLGIWRADLIVACLDSRAARQAVNERAWHVGAGAPFVDSGVLASDSLARVNIYVPAAGAPCLECAWSDEDYALLEQRYPCDGKARVPAPTNSPSALGALAAALLALECRKLLCGDLERAAIGCQFTLNPRWHRSSVTRFRRNPRCRFDHATWLIEPWRCNAEKMRLVDLLEQSGSACVPGRRFVNRMVCSGCGREKVRFHLEGSLPAGWQTCGVCGQALIAPGFDVVERLSGELPAAVLALPLTEAGLRYGDVVKICDRYLMIAADSVIGSNK